jgi:hypothetical protein
MLMDKLLVLVVAVLAHLLPGPNTFHVKVEQVIFITRDIMQEQYKLTTIITIMDL